MSGDSPWDVSGTAPDGRGSIHSRHGRRARSALHPHRRRPQRRDLPARRAPAAVGRRAPPLHAADPARERAPERLARGRRGRRRLGRDRRAEPRDLLRARPRAAAGLHGRAGRRRPRRDAERDGRLRRRPGADQPADPGRARDRPLRAGGRLRHGARPLRATSSSSSSATASATPSSAGARERSATSRSCRPGRGSCTRSTSSTSRA